MPQLIVFAGLPGSGKTTLAKLLAPRLNAVLLNKDEVRAALFAPEDVEYSDQQNDFCMDVIYQLAKYHFQQRPERPVIIDGRTYCKNTQIQQLLAFFKYPAEHILFIFCTAAIELLENRVNAQTDHIAQDRTIRTVRLAFSKFEQLNVPHLTIDTSTGNQQDHLQSILHTIQQKRDQ